EFKDFLEDKYGKLPREAENLLHIYELKILMKKLRICLAEEKGKLLHILLKDTKLLPSFRKITKENEISLIKVVEEKERAHLYFQSKLPSLEAIRRICHKLLA
ncbi:MAG: TRCF domain-containing protein, partial [Caldimicrobium sp.]